MHALANPTQNLWPCVLFQRIHVLKYDIPWPQCAFHMRTLDPEYDMYVYTYVYGYFDLCKGGYFQTKVHRLNGNKQHVDENMCP